jgi:PAS domain S-box-containing protein
MGNDSLKNLKSRVKFLEEVIEYMPFGVMVLDVNGRNLLMNRALEKVSKITREKVLGQYFHEEFPNLLAKTELGHHYWSLVHHKKSFEYIFHDMHPKLKISGIGLGAALPDDEGLILVHHVSEKIREDKHTLAILANNLNESKVFLQNLIDSSPSAILTVSGNGTLRSINKTAEYIFGYTSEELLWKPIAKLFRNKLKLEHLFSSNAIDSGVEIECLKKNKKLFPGRLQISKLQEDRQNSQESLFIITDISREKSLEERLAISEKLAIYSELIAGIFHQINNPLVGVVNFSSILLERMDENDVNRQMVENMHQAALQCRKLITSMMKGFREPQSTFSNVILSDMLKHVVEESLKEHSSAVNKVRIVDRISTSMPVIKGDALQLSQVFRNLLDNAFQSVTSDGTIEISSSLDQTNNEVSISIVDSGCGIPLENLSKIFTPFYSTKKNTGGGLGLSFAHRVITNHSGRIEVSSTENIGTSFTVFLPVHGSYKDEKVSY